MEILDMLSQASIVALLGLAVGILPLGFGVLYAIAPTEERLALMRPISLASIFGALGSSLSGAINALRMFWVPDPPFDARVLAIGSAESLVPLLVAFSSLTVAWLCIAIGMRRHA